MVKREDILRNHNRNSIVNLVKDNKGITFTEIKDKLNLENGVLAYHINVLEKNIYIKSVEDGKYRRFYARRVKVPKLHTVEAIILIAVKNNPDLSIKQITEVLSIHPETKYSKCTVSHKLKDLEEQGMIQHIKIGKHYAYNIKQDFDITNLI
jgi:predicted transcriptional regulator